MFRFSRVDKDEEKFFDASEAFLHPDNSEEGGIAMKNRKLIEQQRGAIMEMVKEMGKKLLMGNPNLMSISMPVKLFEDRSYLQKLTDVWVFPQFLNRAAQPGLDPVERMRLTVTFFMAGFQFAFASWSKPFNPILGETWEATLSEGTRIYMEQISHHPPISAFQVIGRDGLWEFDGMSEPSVSYKGNSLKTKAKGYRIVRFRDGTSIEILYPSYYLRGVMYGSEPRGEITGDCTFIDRANALLCTVTFGPVKNAIDPILKRTDAISGCIVRDAAAVAAAKAGDGRQPPPRRPAAPGAPDPNPRASSASPPPVMGNGRSASMPIIASPILEGDVTFADGIGVGLGPEGVQTEGRPPTTSEGGLDDLPSPSRPHLPSLTSAAALSVVTGSWLSHLDWDGKRYWTLESDKGDKWTSAESSLPSDCRFREDLHHLHIGDREESQRWKELLENKQRRDAKMRKGLA